MIDGHRDIRRAARDVLSRADRLGFDFYADAYRAIIDHPDYESRWDLVDLSDVDLEVLRHYRVSACVNYNIGR